MAPAAKKFKDLPQIDVEKCPHSNHEAAVKNLPLLKPINVLCMMYSLCGGIMMAFCVSKNHILCKEEHQQQFSSNFS